MSEHSQLGNLLNKSIDGTLAGNIERLDEIEAALRSQWIKDNKQAMKLALEFMQTFEKRFVKWIQKEEKGHITDLINKRMTDLMKKCLENERIQVLQELAEFVQGHADLNANTFNFSDTERVSKLISCLQMSVPLFARAVPCNNLLDFVNHHVLSDFDKVTEHRKFVLLKSLAEISAYTSTDVASQMLPLTIELLQKYMPKNKAEINMSFMHVECLLYMLHHFTHKTPNANTQLCNQFMLRLKWLEHATRERMKILAVTLPKKDKDILEAEKEYAHIMELKLLLAMKRQNTKTEMRACNNISAMIKAAKKHSFIGDNSVKLSWKEAKKSSASGRDRDGYSVVKAPVRSNQLNVLTEDCLETLKEYGFCNPNQYQAELLVGPTKFQKIHRNREGLFVLNDNFEVAMLSWQLKESELSFAEENSSNISGNVRDQRYHIICWAYAAAELVSRIRCLRNWEELLTLCTWYLSSFCHPELLGKDRRARIDCEGYEHHCYGATIESGLLHIQTNGIPRENVERFMCTDYHPPSADEPLMERRTIKKVRRIHTLKDALLELKREPKQPIGADLIHYSTLLTSRNHIYYGPKSPDCFVGYHAVIIEGVKRINGELVAICKMSNGFEAGDYGYAYVSLATQFMPVCVGSEFITSVRDTCEPMHLLTNFIVVEMDKKEDEEEGNKDGDEEGDKEEDPPEEKQEEEEPEEEEYKPKRQRTPAPRRFRYFTCSENLAHKLDFDKKCTEGLIKALRDITNSIYQPEYDVRGITDPFLHIQLLKLLRVLGQGDADASDLMTDIHAQVAKITESNKNAGNECVETIMTTEDTSSLRVLAIDILGRFLSNRDSNIRYDALDMLMKAITFDDEAVQRHRVTILECVKDPDPSIRKRALELVSLLVNENNVKQLTKELIDYLEISDEDFKEDLSAKICSIVEKFSPEKIWYIDQMLKVLSKAGKFVKDEVWHALIAVISNAPELHGYTVRALYKAVLTYPEQETLVRVAIWCIGEYGDLLVNNMGMLGIEDPITVTQWTLSRMLLLVITQQKRWHWLFYRSCHPAFLASQSMFHLFLTQFVHLLIQFQLYTRCILEL